MTTFATLADKTAIEKIGTWDKVQPSRTIYQYVERAAKHFGKGNALSFQITSEPTD